MLAAFAANCENSSESDKVLEKVSECHEALVCDSEVHKADDVSDVELVHGSDC